MPIRHGRNAAIYVNGSDISGDLNSINPKSEQDLADVTTFGKKGYTYYPGLAKDSGTIEAIYDDTEKAVFEGLIQAATGYSMMIAFGQSLGDPALVANEISLISNGVKSIVTDVNRASISFDVDSRPFESCKLLSAGKQTVAAVSTGDGTTLDNVTSTPTTGGAGYLQILGMTDGTLTVTIETSSTGAFAGEEATTATFAVASTTGTERVAITGTIERYARPSWVNTGTTAYFALALKREV
uniref:Putative tail protein n=1 Tax=viral metagenome TaxID=1070528 RepID=A0A6M3LSG1_9ZZZZ